MVRIDYHLQNDESSRQMASINFAHRPSRIVRRRPNRVGTVSEGRPVSQL